MFGKLQKGLLKAEKDILRFMEAKGPARHGLDKEIGTLKRDNFMADQVVPDAGHRAPHRGIVVAGSTVWDADRTMWSSTMPWTTWRDAASSAAGPSSPPTARLLTASPRKADYGKPHGKSPAVYREYRTRCDEARARPTVETSSVEVQLDVDLAEQVSAAAGAALDTAKMDLAKAEDPAAMRATQEALIVAGPNAKNVAFMRAHPAIETATTAVVAGTKGAAEQFAAARWQTERPEQATAVQASGDDFIKLLQATLDLTAAKVSTDNKMVGEAKGQEWDTRWCLLSSTSVW